MEFEFCGNKYEINKMLNRMDFQAVFKKAQDEIKDNLNFDDSGMTVLTKSSYELSKGCQACKTGGWWCLYVGNECNAKCKFCPQSKDKAELKKWTHPRTISRYWIDDVKFYFEEYKNKITGVSYSGGEPLLYLDRITEIAGYINNSKNETYQWVYTNGILINKEVLLKLRECGIKEVRVDLAATNFDESTIKKLELIKNIIGNVTVEVPSVPSTYKSLVTDNKIQALIDSGVEQLNLAELELVQPINWNTYAAGEDVYCHDSVMGGTSYAPVYSRFITLNILKHIISKNFNILVNDCSIDAKHLQKLKKIKNHMIY